jgi:hypothetical protein
MGNFKITRDGKLCARGMSADGAHAYAREIKREFPASEVLLIERIPDGSGDTWEGEVSAEDAMSPGAQLIADAIRATYQPSVRPEFVALKAALAGK